MLSFNNNLITHLVNRKAIIANNTQFNVRYKTYANGGVRINTIDVLVVESFEQDPEGNWKFNLFRPVDNIKISCYPEAMEKMDHQTAKQIAEAFEVDIDGKPLSRVRQGRSQKHFIVN